MTLESGGAPRQSSGTRARLRYAKSAGANREAAESLGVLREGRGQDFDGDVTAEARAAGAKDLPHSSGADGRKDLVGAKTFANNKCHGCNAS
jgi:hypothetical protein